MANMNATSGVLAGMQPQDQNRRGITFPADFQHQDATGTPRVSPISVGASSAEPLVVPSKCFGVVLWGEGDFLYGKTSNFATGSKKCRGGVDVIVGVANTTTLYVKSASGTINVYTEWLLNG